MTKNPDTQKLLILLYHHIGVNLTDKLFSVSKESFERQVAYLASEGYAGLNLNQVIAEPQSLPEKVAVITFDDGYYNNFSQAFPCLAKYNFSATIFLAAGLIEDGEIRKNSNSIDAETFLNWTEIREMQKAGIDFQSHGLNHQPFDSLSREGLEEELVVSKKSIEEKINCEVSLLAYPFGRYSDEVKRATEKAGYKGACGGVPKADRSVSAFSDLYEIGRTEILGTDSFKTFKFKARNGVSPMIFFRQKLGKVKRKLQSSHDMKMERVSLT